MKSMQQQSPESSANTNNGESMHADDPDNDRSRGPSGLEREDLHSSSSTNRIMRPGRMKLPRSFPKWHTLSAKNTRDCELVGEGNDGRDVQFLLSVPEPAGSKHGNKTSKRSIKFGRRQWKSGEKED
ncbi:hypothetical protein RvY_05425-1 [Ramazzottius varieornatus]|uniref:Uncharacterized protein n=1 Tax=Ramazzottius varieornatus TaxID=947166 RepID=A0A1D1UVK2_RAMVA|nr:hypothetical protein RvY_05425-1 [Ramazzottius varieornatus]